jgi:hypothetical protein
MGLRDGVAAGQWPEGWNMSGADAESQRPFSARVQQAGNERPEPRAQASCLSRLRRAAVRAVQGTAAVHIAVNAGQHWAALHTVAGGGKHKAVLHTAAHAVRHKAALHTAVRAAQHKAALHTAVRAVKPTPELTAAAHAPKPKAGVPAWLANSQVPERCAARFAVRERLPVSGRQPVAEPGLAMESQAQQLNSWRSARLAPG